MAKDKPRPGLTELSPNLAPPDAVGLAEQQRIAQAPPADPEKAALLALVEQQALKLAQLEGKLSELATLRANSVIDESFEAWKAWAAEPAERKTQIECEKRWGHETYPRWRVSLVGHPSVLIPARDEDEAVLRYNRLCGILSILNNNPDRPIKHAVSREEATAA